MATDWSNDPLVAPPTSGPVTETLGGQASTSPTAKDSTKDTAKQEAAEVGHEGLDAAKNVAQTAGTEARNVAHEAGTQAKNLLGDLGTGLKDQAGAQQQKVTEGIRSFSDGLTSMAEKSDESPARNLVQQAAQRTGSVAGWLEGRDPASLLDEAANFARRRPGTFLLVAAAAGVLAGRFARGATGGGSSTASQELVPAPTQPPAVPPVTAGATSSTANDGVVWAADAPPAGVAAYSDTESNQPGTGLQP
ncbi:hypothetical protein [uncultured Arthrobacter sp.]|uniref:hypothetical protein n=1 Tax=uncultured Arthrobacter sp. TaxID=114050 RepID=UPI002622A3E3|nr:hypothetical protein [uncultured Arthrobacter sp.]